MRCCITSFKRNLCCDRARVTDWPGKCNLSCDKMPLVGSPASTGRKARLGGRSARVREAVLNAAFAELGEKGYDNFSMEAVARRSGVHKTTVYRRWPTRDALVVDALDSRGETGIRRSRAPGRSVRTCACLRRMSSPSCRRRTAKPCSRAWCRRSISRRKSSTRSRASGASGWMQVRP